MIMDCISCVGNFKLGVVEVQASNCLVHAAVLNKRPSGHTEVHLDNTLECRAVLKCTVFLCHLLAYKEVPLSNHG